MIHIATKDRVAQVKISGSNTANLITITVLQQLHDFMDSLAEDSEIRAILFTGQGDKFFLAGADLEELSKLGPDEADKFAELGQSLFHKIEKNRCLSIAAVDGYCMGGGLDLLLSCDLRIATHNSVFAHPGIKIGIITGFGGTVRLSKDTSLARAMDVFYSGRRFTAAEARQYGIINELCEKEKLFDLCEDYARKFIRRSVDSAGLWKKALLAGHYLHRK